MQSCPGMLDAVVLLGQLDGAVVSVLRRHRTPNSLILADLASGVAGQRLFGRAKTVLWSGAGFRGHVVPCSVAECLLGWYGWADKELPAICKNS
ncbi:MAG: hypothetical protein ACREXR_13050 [Gammaproteobacteria bacterium]